MPLAGPLPPLQPEDAASAPSPATTTAAAAAPSASAPAAPAAAAAAAAAAAPSASAPAAARQAPCWVVAAPPERVLADMLRFAWSDSRGATMALAAARLALGVGLLAFTCWSFAEYSSAADFDDGLGGSFARTAVQLTNWALVVAVFFWLLAGAAQLAVELRAPPAPSAPPPPLPAQQLQQHHDRRVRLLVAALWPAAFVLAAVADVLYWSGAATAGAARTTRLGSSIVKHTLLAPLALDLALARLPCAAAYGLFPFAIGAAYLAAAGVYALATRGLAGPYIWLNFRSGLTAAAVFVALAVGAAAFGALWALTRARDRRADAVRAKQKAVAVAAAGVAAAAAAAAAEAAAGGGELEALAAA